jgi:hypothetical protein
LLEIAGSFSDSPEASIPKATLNWSSAKGAYRFFDNPKVTGEKILKALKSPFYTRLFSLTHGFFLLFQHCGLVGKRQLRKRGDPSFWPEWPKGGRGES